MSFEGIDGNLPINESVTIPELVLPSPKIDTEITTRWLEAEPDLNLRKVKKKMAEAVSNIPFSTLHRDLRVVGEVFDETIGETPYMVFWDTKPHGSKRWIHELIKPDIHRQPIISSYIRKPDTIIQELIKHKLDTLAIFDDAAYSGDQLSDSIYVPLWNRLHEVKFPKPVHMVLVIPYVTKDFRYMVKNNWNDDTIKTTLISEKSLPMLWDILAEQEQNTLRAVGKRLNVPNMADKKDDILYQPIHFGTTATTFDHKIPDSFSVCRPLLASVGVEINQRREPYKIKGTPYYEFEKQEYGTWLDDLV